ncbi:MAG: hypothetical protein HY787_19575 [Deltaproteobacteria bacterium]|nr:hypothetical protein [Deltaproteobacteria bacterium]
MKYQCIKCQVIWGNGDPEEKFYSHGLCLSCLKETITPLYRKRQKAEGNFDCFSKACGYCDQIDCKYRGLCLFPHLLLNQQAVSNFSSKTGFEATR